ncbi:unnamed protein product [Hydatigera taeniaeformis]|uniref:USP domain-containing protein n=1 Tax=Hydatigena taeniaeformis TaxID=6205 RepID=A0A0R3X5J5_HYDTA|nr:unnamed protein product [Hydatigera taeniaeformis]
MSSSRILVRSLRHSAVIKRDRLLCSLVVVLEGLGCSFDYLEQHNLIEAILVAHRTLIDELFLTGRWAVNDQQDVHELYGFFMDRAANTEARQTVLSGREDLLTISRLLPFPPISTNGDTPAATVTAANTSTGVQQFGMSAYFSPHLSSFLSTSFVPSSFHQFIVSQIFCVKCSYRSDLRLVPESCIILFPEKSRKRHTKKMSSKDKESYRCSVETMLSDEFCVAESLAGIHCPRCHMEALRIPEAMINDPSPTVSDRSSIRHFAESLCRNTCCARRWIALPPATTQTTATTKTTKSPLVIYIQRAVWIPLKHIAPDTDDYVLSFIDGGMVSKFTEHIIFSDTLDLAPYLATGCTFHALARRSNVKWGDEKSKKKSLPYALRSVIVHHGNTLHAGHYVAYRCWPGAGTEDASPKNWILSSDRYVDQVPFSRVKECQAYMLFYEPMEEDTPGALQFSTSVEPTPNGEAIEVEEGISLDQITSPAQRIHVLMALVCGEKELG